MQGGPETMAHTPVVRSPARPHWRTQGGCTYFDSADSPIWRAHSKQHASQKHAQVMAPFQPSPLAWPQQARPMHSGWGGKGSSTGFLNP